MRVTEDVVAAAARRSREAGTARIWGSSYRAEPLPRKRSPRKWPRTVDVIATEGLITERYGVADLVGRRAHVHERNEIVRGFTEDVLARWPWLVDGAENEIDDPWSESVQFGAAHETRVGDLWMGGNTSRPQSFCAWILDGLTGASRSDVVGREEVRGEQTTRHACMASLGAADVLNLWSREEPAVFANVWIDGGGLIRRATWRALRGDVSRIGRTRPYHVWTVLELWDFGVLVEIPTGLPRVPEPEGEASVFQIARQLAAWRRESRRAQP